MKKAFITGISGQDGYYLTKLLLSKGYSVYGLSQSKSDVEALGGEVEAFQGDVSDTALVEKLITEIKPDEFYHLATVHEVDFSKESYLRIRRVDGDSVYFILNTIKEHVPHCRFFYASSSQIYGKATVTPQNETTPFNPQTLYGICKSSNMQLIKLFREKFNIFACSGILFNHESPRRKEFYLPRKISLAVAKIKLGLANEIVLGSLDSQKDWGAAEDFVQAMWLMLQNKTPVDYVLGTGKLHSIEDVLKMAFDYAGLNWRKYVKQDPQFVRPSDPIFIAADNSKIKAELGWQPQISLKTLIEQMVEADIKLLKK